MTTIDDSGSVTLEELEAYIQENQRPILGSLVPDQAKVGGTFQSGTSGVAPPPAHVEGEVVPPDDDDDDDLSGAEDEVEEEVEDGEVVDDPSTSDSSAADDSDDDLIEVQPGVHMTRAAISKALEARESTPATQPSEASPPPGVAADGTTSTQAATPAPSAVSAPAPALPTIPQELLDDPEMGPVVRLLQAHQADLDQTRQQLALVTDISVTRAREEVEARITAGVHQFRDAHHLTEEQVSTLNGIAARLNVIPSLANGIDPITNEQVPRDAQQAAYRALEIAMWSTPEFRDLEVQAKVQTRAKDQRRKQKLAGISGGSGSVPRTTPVPQDRRGRELAAVTELREMMSPGSEE